MNLSRMNSRITFQKRNADDEWEDYLSCYAYINGLNGSEYFTNAGYEASLIVTISCRFQLALMRVTPMQYRIISNGIIYELLSPGDDIQYKHEEVIFRAKRIYSEDDGN